MLVVVALASVPEFVWAQAWSVEPLKYYGLPKGTLYGIIQGILMWILGIFGFIGIIGFVISGILYLVSAGDDNKMETAKSAMKYSIIGVIVGLCGLVVIMAANAMLNGGTEI